MSATARRRGAVGSSPARRWAHGPQGPQVFAVEDTSAQLTWRDLGPDPVVVEVPAADVRIEVPGGPGPGAPVVPGLPPGGHLDVAVRAGERRWALDVTTLRRLPGPERCRFATLSDLHLAERTFGYWGTIQEAGVHRVAATERAAEAALAEALAWGAQAVVVKGDLTAHGAPEDWEAVARVLRTCPVPVLAAPGNHDASRSVHATDPHEQLHALGVLSASPVAHLDLPGIRLVVADTTRHGSNRGRLRHVADRVLADVAAAPAAYLALHHQLLPLPVPTYWPPGIGSHVATPFLRRLAEANPATLVSSGHTHRHRRRQVGPIATTEVGSPKDYPGTWAGYVVHDAGIRQVVRRVARPDVLAWTERTATAAFGLWQHWSPGRLEDRCFQHLWPRDPDGRRSP